MPRWAKKSSKVIKITKWPTPRHWLANLSKWTEANALKAWRVLYHKKWGENACLTLTHIWSWNFIFCPTKVSGNCQKMGALSPVESARILTSVRTKCLPDSVAHLKWKLHFLALLSCMVNFLSISGKGEKNGAWHPGGLSKVFTRRLGGPKSHQNHQVANSTTQVGQFIKRDRGKRPEGPASSLP